MKKLSFIFICLLFALSSNGQIVIGKRALEKKLVKERYENQIEQGWDIVLDPIEVIPDKQRTLRQVRNQEVTNWGKDLLLTSSLQQRISDECSYPVVFKIGDTGDPDHDYLREGHLSPANYTSAPTPDDLHGHSTHVTGIVCAQEFGLANVLIKKNLLKFKTCKVLGDGGSGSFSWVANMFIKELPNDKAILSNGGFVVYNMSLGGGTAKQTSVEEAMKASTDAGVFIVCANGNTGGPVQYPGNSDYTIGTASLDQGLTRSSYSSYGPETDQAMPGRSINSTYKGNTFAVLSGTSMASPFQSGAVIIALSKWGDKIEGVEHLRKYLAKCATDLPPAGNDDFTGWGIDYITKILDTDPSKIDNPDPDPDPDPDPEPGPTPDPDSLTRESRVLGFTFDGTDYKMPWKTYGSQIKDARVLTDDELQEATLETVDPFAEGTLTVTGLKVEVTTIYYMPLVKKSVEDATNWFFTRRSLGLGGTVDSNDALYWTAFFYDVLLTRTKGLDVNVLYIEATDGNGQKFFISGEKLRKF